MWTNWQEEGITNGQEETFGGSLFCNDSFMGAYIISKLTKWYILSMWFIVCQLYFNVGVKK